MPATKKTVRFNEEIQEVILSEYEESDCASSTGSSSDQDLIDAVIDLDSSLVTNILSKGYDGAKIDQIVVEIEDGDQIIDNSLLDIAISNDNFEIAKILLDHGAREISAAVREESEYAKLINKIKIYLLDIEQAASTVAPTRRIRSQSL